MGTDLVWTLTAKYLRNDYLDLGIHPILEQLILEYVILNLFSILNEN